jgi:hypothetical protein
MEPAWCPSSIADSRSSAQRRLTCDVQTLVSRSPAPEGGKTCRIAHPQLPVTLLIEQSSGVGTRLTQLPKPPLAQAAEIREPNSCNRYFLRERYVTPWYQANQGSGSPVTAIKVPAPSRTIRSSTGFSGVGLLTDTISAAWINCCVPR